MIDESGYIDEDAKYRIRVGWQKWRNASGVLCDKKIPLRLKGRVYHMVLRSALLYGVKCWSIKKTQIQKLMVAEMRMS